MVSEPSDGPPRASTLHRIRERVVPPAVEAFYSWTSGAIRLLPMSSPKRHGVEVIANVPYKPGGGSAHQLDVYRPTRREGPLPVVVYVHGGAFRSLSKDTHWVMALAWAREGYVVFNVNYRLAPKHRYPAACEDLAHAWAWIAQNASRYGGDLSRLVVSGESAGGNLASVMTLATVTERAESWARDVFSLGMMPQVVLPACAILQVSDPQRWTRRRRAAGKKAPRLVQGVLDATWQVYSGQSVNDLDASADFGLMDPLVVAESLAARGTPLARPLPAFFLPVGVADPLVDDHRRMAAALQQLGAVAEARFYDGMEHAFHAFVWREAAQKCWQDSYAFARAHLPPESR